MKINASTIVRNNSNIHFQAKLNGKDSKQINMFQKTGHAYQKTLQGVWQNPRFINKKQRTRNYSSIVP